MAGLVPAISITSVEPCRIGIAGTRPAMTRRGVHGLGVGAFCTARRDRPSQRRHEVPAVDRDRRAGHPARGVRTEEQEGAVEILRLPEPAHGDALQHRLAVLGRKEPGVDVGRDVARCERVDADAVARPFERVSFRHLHDAGLRDRIRRRAARNPEAEDRGDVDDRAAALGLAPALGRRDRHQPDAAQVRRDDAVEGLRRGIERGAAVGDAGVVDEDVERPDRRLGRGKRPRDGALVGDVEIDRHRRFGAGSVELAPKGVEPLAAARADRDRGAAAREAAREMGAEPARRAGDEGALASDAGCQIHAPPLAFTAHAASTSASRSVSAPTAVATWTVSISPRPRTEMSWISAPSIASPAARTVASETTRTDPNSLLRLSRRLAVFTVSPSAVRLAERSAPTRPSTAGPICSPIPMRKPSARVASNSWFSRSSAANMSRAAKSAARLPAPRAAGTPNSAMMPSPKNLSTSPPWRSIASLITSK